MKIIEKIIQCTGFLPPAIPVFCKSQYFCKIIILRYNICPINLFYLVFFTGGYSVVFQYSAVIKFLRHSLVFKIKECKFQHFKEKVIRYILSPLYPSHPFGFLVFSQYFVW